LDFFALNPIGTGPGQVSSQQFATIFASNLRYQLSSQHAADAKLTGFPFKLPAGPFGFALGAEYRRESYIIRDSPEVFIQSVPIKEVSVNRDITSIFLELS